MIDFGREFRNEIEVLGGACVFLDGLLFTRCSLVKLPSYPRSLSFCEQKELGGEVLNSERTSNMEAPSNESSVSV